MTDWFYHLPIGWMAAVVFSTAVLVALAIHTVVDGLARSGHARVFKAVTPTMLTLVSTIFGLIVSFLAAQVWGDADRAHAAVTREAMALRSIVMFAGRLPEPEATALRTLVRGYIDDAVRKEWPAMANRSATLATITAAEDEAIGIAMSIQPKNDVQAVAQREIIEALRNALDARQQRIVISRATINWIKWTVVGVLATLLLFTIAVVHSENRTAAMISMGIFALTITVAVVLIAAHNRPFTGEISVTPELLLQVMPRE